MELQSDGKILAHAHVKGKTKPEPKVLGWDSFGCFKTCHNNVH